MSLWLNNSVFLAISFLFFLKWKDFIQNFFHCFKTSMRSECWWLYFPLLMLVVFCFAENEALPALHSDVLCLTFWVESTATLHGAFLCQFPQLSQAENEQSADKMQKVIVNCVYAFFLIGCGENPLDYQRNVTWVMLHIVLSFPW